MQNGREIVERKIDLLLSPRDLDRCPFTLQMYRDTVLAKLNVYTPINFHQDLMNMTKKSRPQTPPL